MADDDTGDTGDLERLIEAEFDRKAAEYQPWMPKAAAFHTEQAILQDVLRRRAGATRIGANVFIARSAIVQTSRLEIGDNSWVAGGAILRGYVLIGDDCSFNPYCHLAGLVRIGSGVRVAGHVSIYGFNHGIERTDIPIHRQPTTTKGVRIGDGTWIGAGALIVDGVTIGAHCVIAAGAVVTRSFGDYEIIGGNPARTLRNRREPAAGESPPAV